MTEILTRPQPIPTAAPAIGGRARIRVAVVGATGYAGGEMVRLLDRHPNVDIVGLVNRDRDQEPVGVSHPHLAATGHVVDEAIPAADAVFLALPHKLAAERAGEIVATGATIIDQGPDFRLTDPADYPRWYGFEHRHPTSWRRRSMGSRSSIGPRSPHSVTRMSRSWARPAAIPRPASSRSLRSPGGPRG